MSEKQGKPITCRAVVLWEPNGELKVEEVEVAPPKAHEVRVKVLFNALCHTDVHVIDGGMPGQFPVILGHEATGVVESIGEGVTDFKQGDVVIPLFMAQCKVCPSCENGSTNICDKTSLFNFFAGMEDGTTRFTCKGQPVNHFMGTSTFSEYTVVKDIMLTKINPDAPLDKACLIGCGLATGYGAAINTAQVKPGETVAVWGLGAVGLSAVLGAKAAGAKRIIGIDVNPEKFETAKKIGATDCVNPKECTNGIPFPHYLMSKFGPIDKAIECIGNVQCMKQTIETVRKGWGRAVIIGVAPPDAELAFIPFHLIAGKVLTGSCFGDWKSVDDVPKLVDDLMSGKINVDPLITHRMDLAQIEEAVKLLKKGDSIRTVLELAKH